MLAVVVHAANIQDRDGAKLVLAKLKGRFSRLKLIWADGGYAGQLIEWTRKLGRWVLEIVKRSDDVTGLRGPAQAMDRRTNLRVVRTIPPAEQGLRNAHREQRGRDLPGHDSSDGPPPQTGGLLVFIQALRQLRRTSENCGGL